MIRWLNVLVFLGMLVIPVPVWGRLLEILLSPADATCNEEFENIANTLLPGDTLVLAAALTRRVVDA